MIRVWLAHNEGVFKEDSILLWKAIVSNQLLKNTNIVLFLNKIDILKSGLILNPGFRGWFHQPNSLLVLSLGITWCHMVTDQTTLKVHQTVSLRSTATVDIDWCLVAIDLRKKFGPSLLIRIWQSKINLLPNMPAGLHKSNNPIPRNFYCHLTTVTVSCPRRLGGCH